MLVGGCADCGGSIRAPTCLPAQSCSVVGPVAPGIEPTACYPQHLRHLLCAMGTPLFTHEGVLHFCSLKKTAVAFLQDIPLLAQLLDLLAQGCQFLITGLAVPRKRPGTVLTELLPPAVDLSATDPQVMLDLVPWLRT